MHMGNVSHEKFYKSNVMLHSRDANVPGERNQAQ